MTKSLIRLNHFGAVRNRHTLIRVPERPYLRELLSSLPVLHWMGELESKVKKNADEDN